MDQHYYTEDMIPKRRLTRPEALHFAAAASGRGPYTREKRKLISEFARRNHMRNTTRGFDLATLAAPSGRFPRIEGHPTEVAGFDHVCSFQRNRQPVAI